MSTLGIGVALAPASAAGAWVGKRIVDRLPTKVFLALVEIGLVIAGSALLVRG
ncbi:MAG TPA: hypothetical protein PKE05_11935 [Microthrixaceae bacterium]|nr:hypothetical protein [Microthrixaceae bacterium]